VLTSPAEVVVPGRVLVPVLVVLAALSCGGQESHEKLMIRLGHIGYPDSAYDLGARKFKELLEERFPGRVEVRVFGSAQLGEDKEMLEGIRLGTLEMHVPSSVLHSVEPMFGIFDLPFLIEDRGQVERIAEGPIGERLARELAGHDLVLLGFWENGFRMITNNVRPVVRPEDLRGIRLRTPKDPERVKLFARLGASPTSMSFGEVFSALKQGVIDGQENPLSQIVPAHLYEVQRYLSLSRHVYSPAYPVMGRRFFEGLDEDLRLGILAAAREVGRFHRELGRIDDERNLALVAEHMEVSEIDRAAFAAAAEPLYLEFEERYGSEIVESIRSQGHPAAASAP
jgi:tripartite ATP-independent transporter DctP family solute receptor